MYFIAPWDKMLKTITYGVVAFLFLETIAIAAVMFMTTSQTNALLVTGLLLGCNILVIVFTSLYAPQGYVVDEAGITIIRKVSPVHIETGRIESVSRIEKDRFMKSSRTFGNGGLFGYYGSFRNQELGGFKMYATHGHCGVLIRAERNYVLTPDRPEEFTEVVRSYLR